MNRVSFPNFRSTKKEVNPKNLGPLRFGEEYYNLFIGV